MGGEDGLRRLLEHIAELEECQQGQERKKTVNESGAQAIQAERAQEDLQVQAALLISRS